MKERPILFSGEMVRAIWEDRKTHTRRLKGLKIINEHPDWHSSAHQNGDGDWVFWYPDRPGLEEFTLKAYPKGSKDGIKCPYGKPGDLLWVRETWHDASFDDGYGSIQQSIIYRATDEYPGPWRPSIFMPRWASRLTLKIANVRVERLQEISVEDCIAEGINQDSPLNNYGTGAIVRDAFAALWDSINAKRGYPWDDNPWVWVIEFERVLA